MREQQYTKISERAWEELAGQGMTPDEAVRYFSSELQPRTFGNVLKALMEKKHMRQDQLLDRLLLMRTKSEAKRS